MTLRLRILLALLAVSILPLLLVNRYAFAFFHNFAKQQHEAQMVHSARLAGSLLQQHIPPPQRQALLLQHATDTESRIRLYTPDLTLLHDLGESPGLDLPPDPGPAVLRARDTRAYAARWLLTPDRSRLYYFSALPVTNPDTRDLLGVTLVIRHTAPLTRALALMKANQTRAAWISAAASLALALLLALLLTRRLKRLRLAATRYAATGSPDGFTLPGRDEFADLARSFRTMTAQLEARQAYNRDFVLTTLHELKTPLTAILGAADLLQRQTLPPHDRARFARNIADQTERLKRLVDELRALTDLDIDLPKEPLTPTDPAPLLHALVQRLQPALASPLTLHLPDTPLPTLRLNPDRIEQALTNLIENADRYAPPDTPVELAATMNGPRLRLTVRDRGPGIPDENLPRIFDRFFTTLDPAHTGPRGRGLGLAIVKTIVEAHRGTLIAQTHPDGGALVGFELPPAPNPPPLP